MSPLASLKLVRQRAGETRKEFYRRKYRLGQTWDYTAGCKCQGCTVYRRYKGWRPA